jgi:hypothetical protein
MSKDRTYIMTDDEIEAAIYNWLDQSGSHVTDKFPGLEPLDLIHEGVVIKFEEAPDER